MLPGFELKNKIPSFGGGKDCGVVVLGILGGRAGRADFLGRSCAVVLALEWLIFHAVVFSYVKQNHLQCNGGSTESCSIEIFGRKC